MINVFGQGDVRLLRLETATAILALGCLVLGLLLGLAGDARPAGVLRHGLGGPRPGGARRGAGGTRARPERAGGAGALQHHAGDGSRRRTSGYLPCCTRTCCGRSACGPNWSGN